MTGDSTKFLALCLALLGAAAAALWWFSADAGDGAAARAPAKESSTAPSAPPQPAELETPAASERVERDATARQGMAVFLVGNVRTSRGEPAQVDLVLIARNESVGDATTVEHYVRGVEVQEAVRNRKRPVSYANGRVARTASDGSYRIEITEHVAGRLAAGALRLDLSLKVLRTGENPREFDVALGVERKWQTASAPIDLRADLVLRSAGRVHGRVVGREPLTSDAWVALFDLYQGALRRQPLAHARCESTSGAFEFMVELDREIALVAWSAEMRPTTERLRVSDNSAPLEVLLERGERLQGVVKLGPDGVACALDLELNSRDYLPCPVGEDVLAWNGVAFEWSRVYGQSDESGRFNIPSLAPGRYKAHIKAPRGVRMTATTLDVVAPAEDLLVELPFARVELKLFRNGAPAANFRFGVHEQRQLSIAMDQMHADAAGSAVLWLAEDSEVWVNDPDKRQDVVPSGVRIDNPGPGRSSTQRIDF